MKTQNPPRLLLGPPGIGKTARVAAMYQCCVVVLLSSMTEEDIAGLPYREGDQERRTMPEFMRKIHEAHAQGLTTAIFFDEIDKAKQEVADTLLTLVSSRATGSWALPPTCDIWAAANPPEWGGGDGVSQAMQSRFSTRRVELDVVGWVDWLKAQDIGSAEVTQKLCEALLTGAVPALEQVGEGWEWRMTNPRTWELALRAVLNPVPDPEVEAVVYGLLTPNAAGWLMSQFTEDKDDAVARQVATRARQGAATPLVLGNKAVRVPMRVTS